MGIAIGQMVDDFGERIGRRISEASENNALSYAERQAVQRAQARPAHERARRLVRDAASDRTLAEERYETACADLVRGIGSEREVEKAEVELDEIDRQLRRLRAAEAVLADEAGIVRDSYGTKLSR